MKDLTVAMEFQAIDTVQREQNRNKNGFKRMITTKNFQISKKNFDFDDYINY